MKTQLPIQNQPQQRSQLQIMSHNSGAIKQQQTQIIQKQQGINNLQQQVQKQLVIQQNPQQSSQANKPQINQQQIQFQKQNSQGIPYVQFGDGNNSSTQQSVRSSLQLGTQSSSIAPQQSQISYQSQFGGVIQSQLLQHQNIQNNSITKSQSLQQQEKKTLIQQTKPLSGSFLAMNQQVLPITHLNTNLLPISQQTDICKSNTNGIQKIAPNSNKEININNYLSNRINNMLTQSSKSNFMSGSNQGNILTNSNQQIYNFPIKESEKPRFLVSSSSLESQQMISDTIPTAIFPTIGSTQQISNSVKTGSLYENSNANRNNVAPLSYQIEQLPINSFQYKTSVNSLVSDSYQNSHSRSLSNSQLRSLRDQRNASFTSIQKGPSAIQSSNEFSRIDSNLNLRQNQHELLRSPSQDLIVNSQSAVKVPVFSFHNSDQKGDKQISPSDFLSPAVKELMQSVRRYNQQIEEKTNTQSSQIRNSDAQLRINDKEGRDSVQTPINLVYQKMNQNSTSVVEMCAQKNKQQSKNISDFDEKHISPRKDPLCLLSNINSEFSYSNTRSKSQEKQLKSVGDSQKQTVDFENGTQIIKVSDYIPLLYKQNEQTTTRPTYQSTIISDTPQINNYSLSTPVPSYSTSLSNSILPPDILKIMSQYKNQRSNLETIHEENNPETYQTDLSQKYLNNYYWSQKTQETKTELSENILNNDSKVKNTQGNEQNNNFDSYNLKNKEDVNDLIRRYLTNEDLSKNINEGSIQTYLPQSSTLPIYSSIDKYASNAYLSESQGFNINNKYNTNSKEQSESNIQGNMNQNIMNAQMSAQHSATVINYGVGILQIDNKESIKENNNSLVKQINNNSTMNKQIVENQQNTQSLKPAVNSHQNYHQRQSSENQFKNPSRDQIEQKNLNIQELINQKTDEIKHQIENLSLNTRTTLTQSTIEQDTIFISQKSIVHTENNQLDKPKVNQNSQQYDSSKILESQEYSSLEKQMNQLQEEESIKRSRNIQEKVNQEQSVKSENIDNKKVNEQIQTRVQGKTLTENKNQTEQIENMDNRQLIHHSVPSQQKLIDGITIEEIENIIDKKMGQLVEKLKMKKSKRKSTQSQDVIKNNTRGDISKRRQSSSNYNSKKRKSNQSQSDNVVETLISDTQIQKNRRLSAKNSPQKNQEKLIQSITNSLHQQLKQIKSIQLNETQMNKFGPSTDSGRYPTEDEEIINLYSQKTVYNSQTSPQDQRYIINQNQLNEILDSFVNENAVNEVSPNKSVASSQKSKTDMSSENQTTQQDEFYVSVESEENQEYYRSKFSEQEIQHSEESIPRKQKQKTNYTIEETKEEDADTPGNSASKEYAKQILAQSKYGTNQSKPIIKINKTIQMIAKSEKIQSASPYKQAIKKDEKNKQTVFRGNQDIKKIQQKQPQMENNSILKELQLNGTKQLKSQKEKQNLEINERQQESSQTKKNSQLQKTVKQTNQRQTDRILREQKNVPYKIFSKSQGKMGQTLIREQSGQKIGDLQSQQQNINQQNDEEAQKRIERKARLQYLLNLKREKLQQQIQDIDGQITNIQSENKDIDLQVSSSIVNVFKTPVTNSPVQKPRFSSPQPENKAILTKSRSQDKLNTNQTNQPKKIIKRDSLTKTKTRGECLYEIALLQNERRKFKDKMKAKKKQKSVLFHHKSKNFNFRNNITTHFLKDNKFGRGRNKKRHNH